MTYFDYFVPVFEQRVRKLFISSSILNEFSCGKVQILPLCKQQMHIEVFLLHNLEQRLSVFARGCESLCSRLHGKNNSS